MRLVKKDPTEYMLKNRIKKNYIEKSTFLFYKVQPSPTPRPINESKINHGSGSGSATH